MGRCGSDPTRAGPCPRRARLLSMSGKSILWSTTARMTARPPNFLQRTPLRRQQPPAGIERRQEVGCRSHLIWFRSTRLMRTNEYQLCNAGGAVPLGVVNTIIIRRAVAVGSQYAAEHYNAPLWYENIKSVEWRTPRPVQIGSQIDFVAHFLGRRLAYTYEVVEFVPGRRLTMRTPGPPFLMETTYMWEDADASTRMTLR